jgi:protein tyrosine/serine phosphatase
VPRVSLFRTNTAVLLTVLSFAIPATAKSGGATHSNVGRTRSNIRIDNFGQVSPSYFRGAQPQGRDYADLAALGVKTVLDLTSDDGQADEKAMVERAGMSYVRIPMTTHESPSTAKLAQFLSTVDDAARQPVYVHCVGGRHRTGVMTAIYRMTAEGWSADRAFAEMKQYKFGADFLHPEFKQFVYGYHADTTARVAAVATTKAGS